MKTVSMSGADAAQQDAGALAAGVVDQQALEGVDLNVGQVSADLAEHLHPLLHGEERIFLRVEQQGDDQAVEEARGPLDEVEVAVGDRVERPRVDGGDFRHRGRF
jgi:hypothetical protein